ncbi:MAG: DUF4433 domain-containing protein [Phycisphaerae bacterium]|jgi:hypothetical protein
MTPIYHITHVDNLPGIIRDGKLWSDAQRRKRKIPCTNIGYSHIKDRRLTRKVPVAVKGMLGDYVPFNFCSRSVMLYVIWRGHDDYQGGQKTIVHLVSSVEAAMETGRPWAFTDRHADLAYANFFDDWQHQDEVDWEVMRLRQWGGNDDQKERRQAEFLVHDWFPWAAIERIGVIDILMADKVRQIVAEATHVPRVCVQRGWYY